MAKATITLQDGRLRGGSLKVKVEFAPSLRRGQRLTRAQKLAYSIVQCLSHDEEVKKVTDAMGFETD